MAYGLDLGLGPGLGFGFGLELPNGGCGRGGEPAGWLHGILNCKGRERASLALADPGGAQLPVVIYQMPLQTQSLHFSHLPSQYWTDIEATARSKSDQNVIIVYFFLIIHYCVYWELSATFTAPRLVVTFIIPF